MRPPSKNPADYGQAIRAAPAQSRRWTSLAAGVAFIAAALVWWANDGHWLPGACWLAVGISFLWDSTRPPRERKPEPSTIGAPFSKDPDDYRRAPRPDRR